MDANHPLLALASDGPPPFPTSYPQLRRLDRSVVCPICKEPFQGPVSIGCGHSFCSQCIRSSFDVMKEKKCPSCDTTVLEGSIRRNRALEEITDAWDGARPTLVSFCHQPVAGPSRRLPPPQPNSKGSSSSSLNGTKRLRDESICRSRSPSKARKLDDEIVELPDSDVMEGPGTQVFDDGAEERSENDIGDCPLCQASMPIASIPMHIERNCPPPRPVKSDGVANQKSDWKKVFAGVGMAKERHVEMKRITKPNYAIATPGELRHILTEHDLPTTGDKAALQSRVQQWIVLFNSNLDTSHPKAFSALRAQLNAAEASRKRDKEKGKDEAVQELGSKQGLAKYAKEKQSEFERLRREILERDKQTRHGEKGAGADSAIEVD